MILRRGRDRTGGQPGRVRAAEVVATLENLYPELNTAGTTEGGEPKSTSQIAGDLVRIVLDRPDPDSSREWAELFVFIEKLVANDADPPWDDFAFNFLEDLLNAVSHGQLTMTRERVNRWLGAGCQRTATYLDRVWVAQPDDNGPSVMNNATLRRIDDNDLRWTILRMFRQTASGAYVGTPDIVRREAQTGRPGGI